MSASRFLAISTGFILIAVAAGYTLRDMVAAY